MADKPFGCACARPSLESIQTPAIYSVRHIAERAGMSQAQVRALAQKRGVPLHRQGGTVFIRRSDIHAHLGELHQRACRIEGRD